MRTPALWCGPPVTKPSEAEICGNPLCVIGNMSWNETATSANSIISHPLTPLAPPVGHSEILNTSMISSGEGSQLLKVKSTFSF